MRHQPEMSRQQRTTIVSGLVVLAIVFHVSFCRWGADEGGRGIIEFGGVSLHPAGRVDWGVGLFFGLILPVVLLFAAVFMISAAETTLKVPAKVARMARRLRKAVAAERGRFEREIDTGQVVARGLELLEAEFEAKRQRKEAQAPTLLHRDPKYLRSREEGEG
ncbi:MAG: hypothetical protein ACE5F1_02890 [Planctomycetota bacterium]